MPLFAEYLQFEALATRELHTEESIEALKKARIALQETFKERLSCVNWCIPKFFVLRKFEECIKVIGAAVLTDTSHMERTHKDLKPTGSMTNNNPATKHDQAIAHVQFGEGVLHANVQGEALSRSRTSIVSDCQGNVPRFLQIYILMCSQIKVRYIIIC